VRQPTLIGDLDLDLMVYCLFEVQRDAAGDDDLVARDREAAAGAVEKRVDESAAVRIRGREGADRRPIGGRF